MMERFAIKSDMKIQNVILISETKYLKMEEYVTARNVMTWQSHDTKFPTNRSPIESEMSKAYVTLNTKLTY